VKTGGCDRAESGFKLTSVGLILRLPHNFNNLFHRKQRTPRHPQLTAIAVVFVILLVASDAELLVQARLGPLEIAFADSSGTAAGREEFGAIENSFQICQGER
jgi:hypothetical protein